MFAAPGPSAERPHHHQQHQVHKANGKVHLESFDNNLGVKMVSLAPSRQAKPQPMEPARIYGGFGAMNMVNG